MTDLLIINEYSSGGLVCFNGTDLVHGTVYHLEPFITKLKGWDNRLLRETIRKRSVWRTQDDAVGALKGIVTVTGPFFHQQQVLLGWEKRDGGLLWEKPYQIGDEKQLYGDLLGLIASYRIFHQTELLVGQPVWERVCRDSAGVFFPDPVLLSGLAKPNASIPPGLAACHPPEGFHGQHPGPAGDIFYLGLLFYWVLAGELPYPLVRGWPTPALVAGENIPLALKRPDLNPAFGKLVDQMLAKNPEQRPAIEAIEREWRLMVVEDAFWRVPLELTTQRSLRHSYLRKRFTGQLRHHWEAWGKKTALALGGFTLLFLIGSRFLVREGPSATQIARKFYREWASPAGVYSAFGQGGSVDSIAADFIAEREKRLRAAREMLTQPIAAPERVRVIWQKGDHLLAEVTLLEWTWHNGAWQRMRKTEELGLEKTGANWRVRSRRITGTEE